jgi:hypothetical protein
MKAYFKTITSLSIKHDYFSDKELKNVTFHPFEETINYFKNYRILFKVKNNNLFLLQEMDSLENSALIQSNISEIDKNFFFGIKFNDKYFQSRSGFNYDLRKNKLLFNLTSNDNLIVNSDCVIPIWNSNLFTEEIFFTVKNNSDFLVYSSDLNDPNWFENLDTGLYKINGLSFFKCSNCSGLDAILILSINPFLLHREILIRSGFYKWRYNIQSKYNTYADLSIIDENGIYEFSKVENKSNNNISVFLSAQPIKLSEKSISSLSLYNKDINLKNHLPNPEIENARFLSTDKRELVLEAFLTI